MSHAVVTGSASGIGAAVRTRLEAAGHTVVGVDLRDAEIQADLSKADGRAAALREVGWLGWTALLASHLAYYAAFVGVFLVLAAALGATSVLATVPAAVIYQGFTYVAPTPGGSATSAPTPDSRSWRCCGSARGGGAVGRTPARTEG